MLSLLGEGGMGVVYRAVQIALEREVAVKVLKSEGEEDESRFVREGRLLAALACPQIVRVLDADAEGGRLWLVCELVTGENLADRHRRDPLPLGQVLDVVLEVARALELAHASGIVHRDVKPDNVILSPDGSIKLADFGLARDVRSGESLTTEGMVLGTPHYIAPEQVRGLTAGPASDQYALGVMLFWLASGTHPIDGASAMDIMMRKCSTRAPRLDQADSRVPRAIAVIAERALAIEPGDRHASVTEMAAEIERVRPSLTPYPSKPCARAMTETVRVPARTSLSISVGERNEPVRASGTQPESRRSRTSSPPRSMLVIAAVMMTVALGLVLHVTMQSHRLVQDRGDAARRPPVITAADITFRRVSGVPCLEVRTPPSTGLAIRMDAQGARIGLSPLLPDPDALRYAVDPARIVDPVRLHVEAVDGARTTTSLIWPGLAAQLADHRALLARARGVVQDERLLSRSLPDMLGELPRVHATWSRLARPLHDLAPTLLDLPDFPLEGKHQIHEAVTSLRLLDRMARAQSYPALLPGDILGRTFAVGPDGAAAGRASALDSTERLELSHPAEQFLQLANPDPLMVPSIRIGPPPGARAPRAMLELATGPLAPHDLIWISLGAWRFLVTAESHAAVPAGSGQAYQGLDARIIGPEGLRMTARYQRLPGCEGRSVLRSIDRTLVYYRD